MNDNKDCRKRQSTLTDFLPSNNGHRRLTTLDRSKRQLFVAKNRRRSTADWQEATAVEQDDDSSSNNNNNNQNNNNDTVNECNDIPFTSSWSEGDIDHLSDSEEEAEEGYDLTQEDLSRFTAMYSQCPILDEDAEVATSRRDDESDSEQCEALDLTQEECQQFFEEQSHGPTDYVAEPPAKKLKWTTEKKTELSRISQYMKQHETSSTPPVFHDSDTKVYVESPGGELRIFKVGESFILENDSLDLPKAIYNIVELKYSQTTVKKANCKVFMLLRETFVGSKSIKDTPELFSQYVVFRHTKWIALRKLRKQVDAPRCQFMIDPPSKESKGIGWQLSYRLVRATKPCVLEKEPTCLDLFAGVGGMSMGFHNAGFAVRWCVEKDPLTASVLANNQQRLLNKKLKEEMYQLRKHRDSARTQKRVQRDGQKMRCAEAEEEDDGDCRVFDEDVHIFLKKVKRNDSAYPVKGDVNHVHASPPCQGFSKVCGRKTVFAFFCVVCAHAPPIRDGFGQANRTRGMGKNDRSNNELCFAFTRAIRLLQPETASFENVTGMLDLSCVQYLQRIVADLLQLRYQLQLKSEQFGVMLHCFLDGSLTTNCSAF